MNTIDNGSPNQFSRVKMMRNGCQGKSQGSLAEVEGNKEVMCDSKSAHMLNINLYSTVIQPILTYLAETWT